MNASPDDSELRAYQARFAARIRDPRGQARPRGVPARRMRVYEALLFNNLEGFLLACYPVTRKMLGARTWRRLTRRFFAGHRCDSPLFRDIPGAFLSWMQDSAADAMTDRPYLYELMHYEWLELAVAIDPEEIDSDAVDRDGDLLEGIPVLNPTLRLASYCYPVHRIRPRVRPVPADGHDHHYLVCRDREHQVRFSVLNPVTLRLLLSMREGGHTGRELLLRIAEELGRGQDATVVAMGHELLLDLRSTCALTGIARQPDPASPTRTEITLCNC